MRRPLLRGQTTMTRLVLTSKVDSDGILRMTVPVGAAEADREVQVTIEATPKAGKPWTAEDQRKYLEWLDSVAGQWQGEFERMPQGELEERDPLD
jgi:hypothetical protein